MKITPNCSPLPAHLPAPDELAALQCEKVVLRLRQEIERSGGAIPFSRFMELALYAPGLGYYSAGSRKLGPEGDFVTAPELSPLFGRCLARQIAQVLEQIGGGEILELGAGSGALAAVLIEALAQEGIEPARYRILDLSADLRQRQQERLAECELYKAGRVQWLSTWPENAFRGVIVANEVLDAMPVEIFRVHGEGVEQAFVKWTEEGFAWDFRQPTPPLAERYRRMSLNLPAGYVSEINLSLSPWMGALSDSLALGAAFFVDYGFSQREYYHPQRHMGTLMCHYRHRAHTDPLVLPGLQDITAHVDFSAAANAAEQTGLEVLGYTTQANFLIATGLMSHIEGSNLSDAKAHLIMTRQVQKLTSPSEMGELFKVLAVGRGVDVPLLGFGLRDMSGTL